MIALADDRIENVHTDQDIVNILGKLWYSVSEGDDYELAPVGGNRFIMLGVPEKSSLWLAWATRAVLVP